MIRNNIACIALTMLATVTVAATPAGHQAADEAAVLATMDRYLSAMAANDLATMKAMQMPDGMTYRARLAANGGAEIVARPNAYWVEPARTEGPPIRERYWSPTVLIRGPIAVVWAPYEFWVDGKTTHCGVDVFDFVEVDGAWRLANSMWTVEPGACEELRPMDAATIRPAG